MAFFEFLNTYSQCNNTYKNQNQHSQSDDEDEEEEDDCWMGSTEDEEEETEEFVYTKAADSKFSFEERRDPEHRDYTFNQSTSANNNQNRQQEGVSKVGIGVFCAFLPLLVGLLIGFCCYKAGSYERKTFFKGYLWTIGIAFIVGMFIGLIS